MVFDDERKRTIHILLYRLIKGSPPKSSFSSLSFLRCDFVPGATQSLSPFEAQNDTSHSVTTVAALSPRIFDVVLWIP